MKCPNCGKTRFEEGTLALYNSISYIVFNSEKRPFVTLGNSLRARVCLGCGRVDLFAPPKAFKKTSVKRTADSGRRSKPYAARRTLYAHPFAHDPIATMTKYYI